MAVPTSDQVAHVPPDAVPAARFERLRALLLRHRVFAVLLVVGVALRVITWLAYQPALIYTDSYYYLYNVDPLNPQYLDPIGYPLFVLKPLLPIGGLALVSAVQHLAGVGMALLLYATALRCCVRRWLSALVAVPVLLDGFQLQIEQNILSDVWLELLLVLLLWLLLGRGVPGPRLAAVAGLVVALAMTVRMVAITLIIPVVIYALLVGRQWRLPGGWRRIAARVGALVGVFGVVVVAYAGYFDIKAGYWGLSTSSGNSLYGRTAQVADCSKLNLDKVLAQLCPKEPLGQRLGPNIYAHMDGNPNWPGYIPPGQTVYTLDRQFALAVLEKQPWDVIGSILTDFGKGFRPTHSDAPGDPPGVLWQFQPNYPVFTMDPTDTKTDPFQQTNALALQFGGQGISQITGLDQFLVAYQRYVYTPGPLLAALGLVGLVAGFGVGRARGSGLAPAALLTTAVAITVLGTAAVFEFSWRYQLPSLVLFPLGGVLGIVALAQGKELSADGAG